MRSTSTKTGDCDLHICLVFQRSQGTIIYRKSRYKINENHVNVCAYMYMFMYMYTFVFAYIYICTCVYIYTYNIYIYTYVYTHRLNRDFLQLLSGRGLCRLCTAAVAGNDWGTEHGSISGPSGSSRRNYFCLRLFWTSWHPEGCQQSQDKCCHCDCHFEKGWWFESLLKRSEKSSIGANVRTKCTLFWLERTEDYVV